MPSPDTLNPTAYFCQTDGGYVFLDAAHDRYFAFIGEKARWFSQILEAGGTCELSGDAARFAGYLCTRGLLERDCTSGRHVGACTALPPHASCFEAASACSARPSTRALLPVSVALARSGWLVRTHRFADLITTARRWKAEIGPPARPDRDRVIELTGSFLALAPFLFTTRDACLFRSLALMRYLASHGIATSWTFGVRLAPFGAHCWIEHEGSVLNDHLEHAAAFTPILSI